MKILNKKEKMTVAKKRRKRLFDAALPLNYPRKAWTIGWRSISRAVAIVSGIQGREPALQRTYSSQENQCNIMVPALTEDDVRSDLQKHTAKTLNESNVAIVLLNLWKDWAVWKRNNVSGSDVFNPLNNQLTIWKARNASDPKNPSRYFLNPQI